MFVIELTPMQYALAYQCAVTRDTEAKKLGLKHSHGFEGTDKEGRENHVWGAAAEVAAAEALKRAGYPDIAWRAEHGTWKENPDVMPFWDVRCRSRSVYDAMVRDNDPNYLRGVTKQCPMGDPQSSRRRFVHVFGEKQRYYVVGWIWTIEAKQPQWSKNHGGREYAYFVPKRYLTPIGDSNWAPQHLVVGTSLEYCDRCQREQKCVHIAVPHSRQRVDCGICDKFLHFTE